MEWINNIKEQTIGAQHGGTKNHYAKWKKPGTKDYILYITM